MCPDLEIGSGEQGSCSNAASETGVDKDESAQHEDSPSMQLTEWDGPDDPENPQNWSLPKKAIHVYVVSWLGLATTLGISSFSPAIRTTAIDFRVSEEVATLALTLYVVGQALGPCLAAPLSETYGRKAVFLITLPLGLLFTLGTGFSHNIWTVLILRFFAGVFSSPSLSVGAGILADILTPPTRFAGITIWTGCAFSGTALGPVLTSYAVQNKGWRWTQWILIFVNLAGWIPSLFTSESYKKILLARRAKKRGLAPPPEKLASAGFGSKAKFFLTLTLSRPIAMLFLEPIVTYITIYVSVVFSVLFSFFEAFPLVFSGVYGFTLGESGISFVALLIGIALGTVVLLLVDRHVTHRHLQEHPGESSSLLPEHRLYGAMFGSFLISGSMFWFGWSSRVSVPWISAEIATAFFGVGILNLTAPCLQYLLDCYGPLYGASAVGANNLVRYLAGGACLLYTRQMYHALGIGWAVSLLAFVTVVLLPVPFVLFKFGASIRARSSYKPAAKT